MTPKLLANLEHHYSFRVLSWGLANRGQVARETYKIVDDRGGVYFCKITDRSDFIEIITPTLPVVRELRDQGFSMISAPLEGKAGFSLKHDGKLIVLYDFVAGVQGHDYDLTAFGRALGQIHAATPTVKTKLPVRGFETFREEFLTEELPRLSQDTEGDDVQKALCTVLQEYAAETAEIVKKFLSLQKICSDETGDFVNTHGDVHGNVLVRSPQDYSIIDWDEMEYGPAERDLWLLSEKVAFMEGYRQARPRFELHPNAVKHAVLKNYLEGIPIYLNSILDRALDMKTRLSGIERLRTKRLNGWMKPRVHDILKCMPSS